MLPLLARVRREDDRASQNKSMSCASLNESKSMATVMRTAQQPAPSSGGGSASAKCQGMAKRGTAEPGCRILLETALPPWSLCFGHRARRHPSWQRFRAETAKGATPATRRTNCRDVLTVNVVRLQRWMNFPRANERATMR
jgi:hypothetical protein